MYLKKATFCRITTMDENLQFPDRSFCLFFFGRHAYVFRGTVIIIEQNTINDSQKR